MPEAGAAHSCQGDGGERRGRGRKGRGDRGDRMGEVYLGLIKNLPKADISSTTNSISSPMRLEYVVSASQT